MRTICTANRVLRWPSSLLAGCAARGRAVAAAAVRCRPPRSATAPADVRLAVGVHREDPAPEREACDRSSTDERRDTLESRDPELAAELLRVATRRQPSGTWRSPSITSDRGVLDAAYRHFNRAVDPEPARRRGVRRTGAGVAGLGPAASWRSAMRIAPRSTRPRSASRPEHLRDHHAGARPLRDAGGAYELASRSIRTPPMRVNNLCYLSFSTAGLTPPSRQCSAALALDPSLTAARNNLALAFAAPGRMDLARDAVSRRRRLARAVSTTPASSTWHRRRYRARSRPSTPPAAPGRPSNLARTCATCSARVLGFRAPTERLDGGSQQ